MISGGDYQDNVTDNWNASGQLKITDINNISVELRFSGPKWAIASG